MMALPHPKPGAVVSLRPLGDNLKKVKTSALVKTGEFEAVRLVLPAGAQIPAHKVEGSITLHCLEGRISLDLSGRPVELVAGDWMYLDGGEPHSLLSLEDSSALLTIVLVNDIRSRT